MNPVTVLHETMRAAGDSRLTKWHQALVEKGKITESYDDDIAKDIASRDQLQRQVDELAPDVENYEARAELEEQVSHHHARTLANCSANSEAGSQTRPRVRAGEGGGSGEEEGSLGG